MADNEQFSAYEEEQRRLDETKQEIATQLAAIGGRYYGDDYFEQVLDAKRLENRQRLELLSREPYFGRLDFREQGAAAAMPLYIGKRGMERSGTSEPYIIDWRAPVASLFYTFTGGDDAITYEAPEGTVRGEIDLKRNIAVRDQELDRVVDSYVRGGDNLGLRDEFLLYRLGEKKDNRLRDIVSTIQVEQDRIIRAPRRAALIIQGAAGSGKTTVALHRLAYLLYQHHEDLRSERMIIFAPNALFLDYISGVLPELGAGDIQQTTFAAWVLELLQGEAQLAEESVASRFALDAGWTQHSVVQPIGRIKGSLAYKDGIESALQQFEEAYVPAHSFEAWEGVRLEAEVIRGWYSTLYGQYPLADRRERLIARIQRWLDTQLKEIKDTKLRQQQAKKAKQRLRTFLKKLPIVDTLLFYRTWLQASGAAFGIDVSESREVINDLKRGVVHEDDLAALAWVHMRFYGYGRERFDHVVIDEAQDFSPFQVFVLHARTREPSFTILGDLAQGIHGYRGMQNWKELEGVFASDDLSYHELRQSYRSTLEIIEFANKMLPQTETGLPPAVPVFRSGEEVELRQLGPQEPLITTVQAYIRELQQAGMRTIAVVGRTNERCAEVYELLGQAGNEVQLVEEGQKRYNGGLSIVPVYLAKGLEFDAVLLLDTDSRMYPSTPQDAKLLYVGCTRALHRLILFYEGEPSPLLGKAIPTPKKST